MRKILIVFAILLFITTTTHSADNAVECLLKVYQFDSSTDKDVLLYADSITLLKDIQASGFLLAFSTDIEIKDFDSLKTSFQVHVVTLGPIANTYSRSYTVEYGLPARLDNIKGKNDVVYTLVVEPVKPVTVNESWCPYNHRIKNNFEFTPTANTDIFYVPNSLGDYYWDTVKELMEKQYRSFRSLFNFNLPGKYSIYLYPCVSHAVIWDKRFWMSSNPSTNSGFAIYNTELNTADPFLVIMTALMRNWGYSPAFISEGLANYLSVSIFDMKEIFKSDRGIPISNLLDTYEYYKADPWVTDRTGASFVRFLVNTYGLENFSRLYKEADDLNLSFKIEEIYGTDIDILEAEWKIFIDTSEINFRDLGYQAYLAEMMFNYKSALRYCRGAFEMSRTANDSLATLPMLKRAYFFNGDYYNATDAQELLTGLGKSSSTNWMAQGSYKMMNGLYDEALKDLENAWLLDSTDLMVAFNLGLYYQIKDDKESATAYFKKSSGPGKKTMKMGESNPLKGEGLVMLGHVLRRTDDETVRAQAKNYFNEAKSIFAQIIGAGKSSPASNMWMGISCIGLDEYDDAMNYLQVALFLETRPFYLGMINLWLGKLYDLKDDRATAREYYGKALSLPSAVYHQEEAKKYLEQAYTQ